MNKNNPCDLTITILYIYFIYIFLKSLCNQEIHRLVIVRLDKKENAQKSLLPTSELYRYKNNE